MASRQAKLAGAATIEVTGVPPELAPETLDAETADCRALWEDDDVRRLCAITHIAGSEGYAVRTWAATLDPGGAGTRVDYAHLSTAGALYRAMRHHEDERLAPPPEGLREAIGHAWAGRLDAAREGVEHDIEQAHQRTLAQCEGLALRTRAAGQSSPLDAALEAVDEAFVKGDYWALGRTGLRDGAAGDDAGERTETAEAIVDALAPLDESERAAVHERAKQRQKTMEAHPNVEIGGERRAPLEQLVRHLSLRGESGAPPNVRCARTGRLAHPVEGTTPAEHGASFADEMGALGRREALARYERATGAAPREGEVHWATMRTLGEEPTTVRTARMYREAPAQRLRHATASAFALDASEAIAVERAFAGPCTGAPALSVQAGLRTEALMSHGLEREALEESAVRCARTALAINAKWMNDGDAWKDANGEASIYEGLWHDGVERLLGDAVDAAQARAGTIEGATFEEALARIDDVRGGDWARKVTERVLEHGRACAERAAGLGAERPRPRAGREGAER